MSTPPVTAATAADAKAAAPASEHYTVTAEDAPLGVQLWPTRAPQYAPNYTLACVSIVRGHARTYVLWTYESGTQRTFKLGEQVTCRKVQPEPCTHPVVRHVDEHDVQCVDCGVIGA